MASRFSFPILSYVGRMCSIGGEWVEKGNGRRGAASERFSGSGGRRRFGSAEKLKKESVGPWISIWGYVDI